MFNVGDPDAGGCDLTRIEDPKSNSWDGMLLHAGFDKLR
jgi:hypothetical protein